MNRKKIVFGLLLFGILRTALFSQTSIAILGYENLNGDPRYDYLGGMLLGITLFDFASNDDISLVNRADLEVVLAEQQLGLSGIIAGNPETIEIGNMIGAEYLLKGEYVFMGADLLVTASIINVSTGKADVFRERGSGENMVHSMNSKIQKLLTGKNVNLVGQRPDRSLISLADEKPGTVKLYSYIQQAEIFVDNEFYGYTTGSKQDPLVIENLKPGKHTIRLHLHEFGDFTDYTLKEFGDWEQEIAISPGQTMVVKSSAAHISDKVRHLKSVIYGKVNLSRNKNEEKEKSFESSFTDRKGNKVDVKVTLYAKIEGKKLTGRAVVFYNGTEHEINVFSPEGRITKEKKTIEVIDCELSANSSYVYIDINRNDFSHNEMMELVR